MTIDSITGKLQSTTATKTNQKNNIETNKAPTVSGTRGDSIDLTANTARINRALESAAALPVIDNDRVASVKQALANGTYRIDAEKIAQKMTQFDSLINQDST